MASIPVDADVTERILRELDSDTNRGDGAPASFSNEPIQDSTDSDSNSADSIDLDSPDYRININGTSFNFMAEFYMLFYRLTYSGEVLKRPFFTETILERNFIYKNPFVKNKCNQRSLESITSTQRIVAYILTIMPVDVKQHFSGRIVAKDFGQRRYAGPATCSARRPCSTFIPTDHHFEDPTTYSFFSYLAQSPLSIGNSSESYEFEFARRRSSPEERHLYCRIVNLDRHVLGHFQNINNLAEFTLNQYESGSGLDLTKTYNVILCYFVMGEMRKEGIKEEETFDELALIVANNCAKYMLCTFQLLHLRDKLRILGTFRSYIQYAIFLLNIHRKMDTEVKNISMNIRRLVRVAKNYLFWTK